ncbi:MAG: protein kinase [Gemmatimonadota bacterium]|nr:MAG: protein kinase [Gemmatimonadota bacterium]
MSGPDGRGAALPPEAVSELRHDLRTPVNHIVGYAEMLLEDAGDGDQAGRAALEQTLVAARDVLTLINGTLSSGGVSVSQADIVALYTSLAEPQQRIVRALSPLLDADGNDEEFTADLRRILSAADKLVTRTPAASATVDGDADAVAEGAADGQARILVVDDVEDNRVLLERRLRRQGHAVESVDNGQVALEMAQTGSFDLILLDVLMPEMDGYEVLERLKQSPVTRHLPVIMISALDDLSSVVRCIERGAEDYLSKPFDPVLLRARITACLEKKRLRDREIEYLEQVRSVIDAASAVEAGSYAPGTLADTTGRNDELGRLARVFDRMASEVRAREDRLRNQVEDLRREIESAREGTASSAGQLDHANLPTSERFADRYEITAALGQGAMGAVYRARDLELEEEIAIKTLRPELVVDPMLIERFKTEIRLARRITHRNVVRTHDFGEWAGIYYLTMEYVEGMTVRQLIDGRGRLGVSATLAIASQLAQALEVAHGEGVIHRDIKPHNLLLDGDGVLKVMDFGIARLSEATMGITETGLSVGTPAYMSPEQLLAESDLDERSDLYAVGVVLYECLTGGLPFAAKSPMSLVAMMLSEEPTAPQEVNSEIPPALSGLILQLLAKQPERRLSSARELGERLAQLE